MPTLSLLGLVTDDSANNGIFLAFQTISSAVDVLLRLGSIVFGLSACVLFLPGLLPGGSTGEIADGLNNSSLHGMILTGGLARLKRSARSE